MERIVIACTPRTGSSLLQQSLNTHPNAINAGEWFAYEEHRNKHYILENKLRYPTLCNLVKVFSFDYGQPQFNKVLHSGKIIYLYRENVEAQVTSWKKACESGIWRVDQQNPLITPFPSDALEQINQAKELFTPVADVIVSYEHLIDHWEESVKHILQIANWPIVHIPMALEKQS